jgi:hypothetical protein
MKQIQLGQFDPGRLLTYLLSRLVDADSQRVRFLCCLYLFVFWTLSLLYGICRHLTNDAQQCVGS